MMPPLQDEAVRLEATRAMGLLDTEPEAQFDELVQLAAQICGVPVGMMTLLDTERQFHKSHIGVATREVPRSWAFCDHTIRQYGVMEIENAEQDERFAANPLVTGESHLRFYAGTPLVSREGLHVGALCVMDMQPHTLTEMQRSALMTLGRQISLRMEMFRRSQEMQQLTQELQLSRETFRSFANAVPIEAYLKDSQGRLVFYNSAIARRFGVTETEWLGKTSYDIWPQEVAANITREDKFVLQTLRPSESYVELPDSKGGISYWKNVKVACEQSDGEVMLACISIDLTDDLQRESRLQEMQDQLEVANRKLQMLSMTDELTGLWNRRAYEARMEEEIAAARRSGRPLSLILIDLDDFKRINDSYGHRVGDTVLQTMAMLLMTCKRMEDVAVRYGGEEFVVLLPNSEQGAAEILCARLLERMKTADWKCSPVMASMGIAVFDGRDTASELMHRADVALYAAKRAGKARYMVYGQQMERA